MKDNYNQVLENMFNHKISKIYINTNYKELVSVDEPTSQVYETQYHYVDNLNPIVVNNLVEKGGDLHIPVYFTNFTPDILVNMQNLLGELMTLATTAVPVLILLSILSVVGSSINPPRSSRGNFINKKGSNRGKSNGGTSNSGTSNGGTSNGGTSNSGTSNSGTSNSGTSNNGRLGLFGMPMFNDDNVEEFVKPNVSLASWAGSPEVIEECKEVITYIEQKEIYKTIGADMPKGILLEGPPGTGKTLLAKAIATETNSTFIAMSGSEFVELFVGMGASRVRDLFDTARKNRPCIIFIDEIDAVGRQRGAGINMANDEREQTLNQLLYEMDGFEDNEDIVVMAATNRKDVLDQALLRPGRFDRILRVPLPDKPSREKILDYYLSSKKTEGAFDISAIAELADGFSGAELKNLVNEAAILSARNNYTIIQEKYVFDAFEKSVVGLIRANATVAPATKTRVAIHEAGHSLLSLYFNKYFDFQKASIQPTYNGAGGYTIFTEKPDVKEGGLYTKDILKKRLIITMGGKAAETIYYGTDYVSLGAVQDLKQANRLAQRMIGNFGMGDKMEVFYNEDISDDANPFLGRSLGTNDKYSEYTRYIMDKESLSLVNEAFLEAKRILSTHKEDLIDFSNRLQQDTILMKKDIDNIFPFFPRRSRRSSSPTDE